MTAPSLFDQEQAPQIDRVTSAIGGAILEFCRVRLRTGGEFFADDLRRYVTLTTPTTCAPGSPDRILRALRRAGRVDYEVISRKHSHYRVMRVA